MDAHSNTSGYEPDAAREPAAAEVAAPRGRRGCAAVAMGVVLVLVGIPMLICPGPGMATIAAGIGMIAVGLGLRPSKER